MLRRSGGEANLEWRGAHRRKVSVGCEEQEVGKE